MCPNIQRNSTMTRLETFAAAAAVLSMMIAPPVFAQAAIQEPGAFAFYHPDADVLNSGRPTPAESSGAMASVPFDTGDAYAAMAGSTNASACARRYHSYASGSGTFPGYHGQRHSCR
jgi:hypothetical protein